MNVFACFDKARIDAGIGVTTSTEQKRFRLATAMLATCLVASSMLAYANEPGNYHRGVGASDAYQSMDVAHLRVLVQHVMAKVTPEQKVKITAIIRSSESDLDSMGKLATAAKHKKVDFLLQDVVDHPAFENAQMNEIRAAEQLSKRIDRVLSELVEAMTPEQRAQLREDIKAFRG